MIHLNAQVAEDAYSPEYWIIRLHLPADDQTKGTSAEYIYIKRETVLIHIKANHS